MSDNIAITVNVNGGKSTTRTFEFDDGTIPPPPMDDGESGMSFDAGEPPLPPEDMNEDYETSSPEMSVQMESTDAPLPPDDQSGSGDEMSYDETNEPPPPE
jgi:hypothetical protein